MSNKNFGNTVSLDYINRWLDVTKSTMLFSRGVILVEGIAEALIIPRLAEIVLKSYNKYANENGKPTVADTLDEMGISVININGINFMHFMKLFGNFNGSSGSSIPIYCAGLTDRDPGKDVFPVKGSTPVCENPMNEYLAEINQNEYTKLYISPLKTFEYDLGIDNPVTLATTLKSVWANETGSVQTDLTAIINRGGEYGNVDDLAKDCKFIYEHIETVGKGIFAHTLSQNISDDFIVPQYIEKAVLWACGGIIYDHN